jgi:hypothetical protein
MRIELGVYQWPFKIDEPHSFLSVYGLLETCHQLQKYNKIHLRETLNITVGACQPNIPYLFSIRYIRISIPPTCSSTPQKMITIIKTAVEQQNDLCLA